MTEFMAGIAQTNSRLFDVEANLQTAERWLAQAASQGVELIVFPELALSGYYLADRALAAAQMIRRQALERLCSMARQHHTALVMGLPMVTEDDDAAHDSLVMIDGEGRLLGSYHKTHLFAFEREMFKAGDSLLCLEWRGVKLGFCICYDIEFPELCRALVLSGSEVLICCSAVPEQYKGLQEKHARMRAIENQVYCIWANRTGKEGERDFFGASRIISPTGAILAHAGRPQTLLMAPIDTAEIEKARSEWSYLEDRRTDLYNGEQQIFKTICIQN